MTQRHKEDLKRQVIRGAREYGSGSVLFRHVIGEMFGVNATNMECLGVIFFKGVATPSELARYTGLSSGATTAMLDRLEKSELIARRRTYERLKQYAESMQGTLFHRCELKDQGDR